MFDRTLAERSRVFDDQVGEPTYYTYRFDDEVPLNGRKAGWLRVAFPVAMAWRQADYYSNTDWLSEEEKAAIAAKEEARREAMDTRSRSVSLGRLTEGLEHRKDYFLPSEFVACV